MSVTIWRLLSHKLITPWQIDNSRCRLQCVTALRWIGSQSDKTKEHHEHTKAAVNSLAKSSQEIRTSSTTSTTEAARPKLGRTSASESAWSEDNVGNETAVSSASKSKLSSQQMRQNVEGYMLTRFFAHVKNYDKVLEKNFPSAVKVYRVFFDGVTKFYSDMKSFLKISRIVQASPEGLKALNRKELELYMRMPRDMLKVAPALIGSSLPMIGYVIFPIVFMYPRTFLTSHFWSLEQRTNFQELYLKERLSYNRLVLRQLQAKLRNVQAHEKHAELNNILGLLGSGFHPSVESILQVKDLFTEPPYSLTSLSSKHLKHLTQLHGLSSGFFKVPRLEEHAFLVHHMDLAIRREGDVHNLPSEALRYSCYIRGLNPINLSNSEMIDWLRNWITISTSIESEHISLFLHLPVLLAYNHPNNWHLIYQTKKT